MLIFAQPICYFNPLPRKEGDDDYFSLTETAMHFNPLPRKEGDVLQVDLRDYLPNFNPLPRKEGDCLRFLLCQCQPISIRSLVKRETLIFSVVQCLNYFNPLPRKEGDGLPVIAEGFVAIDFNPLPRKEGDHFVHNPSPNCL